MDEIPPEDNTQEQKKGNLIKAIEIDQDITVDEILEKFPSLYKELTDKKMNIRIDEVKGDSMASSFQEREKTDQDPFSEYDPDVFDFLARAKTDEEGLEIITFLAKQGRISSETEKELTKKLNTFGIRYFGPLRSSNYYFKKSEEIRRRQIIHKRYPPRLDDEKKR